MGSEIFESSILAFKRRKPFHPFTIVTVGGSRHEIDHAEAIIVRGSVALHLAPGNVPVIFDGVSEIIGDLAGTSVGS